MSAPTDSNQQATLSWSADASAPVSSVAELDERLNELERRARAGDPFAATLERPDGAVLTIGLGRERSVLNYMASADPPYYTSHDPSSTADGTVVFYFFGHWSEFPADAAVPNDAARAAARRFFTDGRRPDNIDWRMD